MSRLTSHRVLGLVATAIVTAAIALPLGVIASHRFSDVPDSNTYHNDIDAIADAGVTTGCGNGTIYCPGAFVTREQMAAFMNRLGALGPGKVPVVNADKLDGLTSSQLARTDQVQHYSCAGPNMDPLLSATSYGGSSTYRYLSSGNDFLSCAVHLPNGATVSGFWAHVFDNSNVYGTTCGLVRVPSDSGATAMANTPSSGNVSTPGYTLLFDATIDTPVIDNSTYAYSAHCYLYGDANNELRVHSVMVSYTGAP